MSERCVCCGAEIPEGRQVCPSCEQKVVNKKLIYTSDARKAILKVDPKLAYCIDDIKGVDAVEVVHGRWVTQSRPAEKESQGDNLYTVIKNCCSICYHESDACWNYCPNCGAKMDGDGNG